MPITAFGPAFTGNGVTTGDQTIPSVTRTGNNAFYVTYLSTDSGGVIRQTGFDANGSRSTLLPDHTIGGAGLLTPNSGFFQARGASFTSSEDMVTWYQADAAIPGNFILMAQLFDTNGNGVGSAIQVSHSTALINTSLKATFTVARGGNVMFSWSERGVAGDSINNDAVVSRIYDSTLIPVTGQFRVNTTTAGNQQRPKPTALGNGNFEDLFLSFDSGSFNIRGRVFAPGGNAVSGSDFTINTTSTFSTSRPGYQRAALGSQSVVA